MTYWLDILLSIPLLWMLYKGFSRGFIMEMTRLVALIAGVYLAARFSELLSEYVYKNTEVTYPFLPILAFAAILITVIVAVYFFGKALEKVIRAAAMGWADKASGAFFGFLRGAFMLSLLLMLLNRFTVLDSFNRSEAVSNSYLFSPIVSLAPFVLPILEDIDKDTVLDRLAREADKVEDAIRGIIPE
jgi:membrane protein required for colicin V production